VGRYRARDLLLAPSLASLTRLPLGVAFVLLRDHPSWALVVLVLAGLSDVLDGHLARRLGQATPTGAVVDGVVDKLFAAAVIGGLLAQGQLPWLAAALLATRELGELPLVVWWAVHEDGRRARAEDPKANWLGKLATVCQFATIADLLVRGRLSGLGLAISALMGAVAAVGYWRRELRSGGAPKGVRV